MLAEVCAYVLSDNEVIDCVTGAGAQNTGDSDCCDWVVVEPGRSVTYTQRNKIIVEVNKHL